jgi:hypothetical protein
MWALPEGDIMLQKPAPQYSGRGASIFIQTVRALVGIVVRNRATLISWIQSSQLTETEKTTMINWLNQVLDIGDLLLKVEVKYE